MGHYKVSIINLDLAEIIRDEIKKRPGVSNTQVNKILTTASSVMKRQVGRTIAANPFETLDRLPNERSNDDEEENTIVAESQVYAPSEVLTLINAADELYARTILHCCA